MAITTYAQLGTFMTTILNTNGNDIAAAPHKDFWNTLSYAEFTTGNVPGIGAPLRVVVPGNSANSTLIQALRGQGLFDGSAAPGHFPRMPADSDGQALPDGTPFFTDDQIGQIAAWIDANCPN